MADSSPLAGLLERAGNVFSLAGKLGRAFHEDHKAQGRLIDPAGWNRHASEFEEFRASLLDLRDAMQNPPDGFGPVAEPLMEAARIAKGIREVMQRPDGRTWAAYLEFFPRLNSVFENGGGAVKQVIQARRLDDPFAFVRDPASVDTETQAVSALEPVARRGWTAAEHVGTIPPDPGASYANRRADLERFRNFLAAKYTAAYSPYDLPLHIEVSHDTVTGYLLSRECDVVRVLDAAVERGWLQRWVVRDEPHGAFGGPARVSWMILPAVLVDGACAKQTAETNTVSWVILSAAETKAEAGKGEQVEPAGDTSTPTKAKRSTERGEGRAKLISALTKHHEYADGGCLNMEPIGNNELARLAGVSTSTASEFFDREFSDGEPGGHAAYKAMCHRAQESGAAWLIASLRSLNDEYRPHHFRDARPADEIDRQSIDGEETDSAG